MFGYYRGRMEDEQGSADIGDLGESAKGFWERNYEIFTIEIEATHTAFLENLYSSFFLAFFGFVVFLLPFCTERCVSR